MIMTVVDGVGYFAASLVLGTFCAKTMVPLRSLAIASNLAFITYAACAGLWPILVLHAIMLPLNLLRLNEALGGYEAPALVRARGWAPARSTDQEEEWRR
jgi:CRP/FNR family cyclic AMP-dependent transcriptional regulator